MTVFAIHVLVRPVERPGRGEVIKPGTEGRLRVHTPDGQHEHRQARNEQEHAKAVPS
jgi:hypothetical protein